MARTVEIDEDLFIDLIYDRVDEVKHNWGDYGDEFWEDCIEYLSDIGWLKPDYNDPRYIVDMSKSYSNLGASSILCTRL